MKLLFMISLIVCNANVFSQTDIHWHGTSRYLLKKPIDSQQTLARVTKPNYIRLMNIELSPNAWNTLNHKTTQLTPKNSIDNSLPTQVQLGMSNVPVLDQGAFGTCVTFAATAAVDALLNQGDYISQLCQLELGQYLANYSHLPSGWDGSLGSVVLHQMNNFGFVQKRLEKTGACDGSLAYPTNDMIPKGQLSPQAYYNLSEGYVDWTSLVDPYQVFVDEINKDALLMAVKDSLNQGDRLLLGVMLFAPEWCVVGACGKHQAPGDTWVVTPMIKAIINAHGSHGEHEMIITGYDDEAIATDEKGRTYQGLLTLRNSWGSRVGNAGDFYMSYDYFKRLVVEVERVRGLTL